MTKKEIEKIVGHTIRKDTFMFVNRLRQGQSYDDIYESLNNNRAVLGIGKDMPLTSKTTCMKIIEKINKAQQMTEEDKDDWENKRGIYAISIDDVIIYIGKTNSSFKKRFQSHKYSFQDKQNTDYLYRELRIAKEQGKDLKMYPLIVLEEVSVKNELNLTERDLNIMELTLISIYQPRCNIEGVLKPYKMRYK